MNEKGNVILFILLGFVVIAALPPLIMMILPQAQIIFQLISIFIIYSIVRGYLGAGVLTLIVSAILIYFLVFKYIYIFAPLYIFQILLGLSFTSVVMWGIGTSVRKH